MAYERLTMPLIVILLASLLIAVLAPQATASKCVPLQNWDITKPNDLFNGIQRPICYPFLKEAGVTHIWAHPKDFNDILPTTSNVIIDESDEGLKQMLYLYSHEADKISRIFTPTQPSPLCQRTIINAVCVHDTQRCDPIKDVRVGDNYKPCDWLCQLLSNTNTCTTDDLNYLQDHGVDIFSHKSLDCATTTTTPTLPRRWNSASSCWSPSHLAPHIPHARCELYTGDTCRGVYGTSATNVYIPNHSSQLEMEQVVTEQVQPLLNTLPFNGACAQAFTMAACKQAFRACYPTGLAYSTRVNDTMPWTKTAEKFPLALPPLISTCESFNQCENEPIFKYISAGNFNATYQEYTAKSKLSVSTTEDQDVLATIHRGWFLNCTHASNYNKQSYMAAVLDDYRGTLNYLSRYGYEGTVVDTDTTSANTRALVGNTFPSTEQRETVDFINYQLSCPAPFVWPQQVQEVMGRTTDYTLGDVANGLTVFAGVCSIPCPQTDVLYTKSERDTIRRTTDALITIAMVCSGLLLLTMVVFNSQRRKRILLKYVSSYWLATLFMFIGMRIKENGDTWTPMCKNNVESYHMEGVHLFLSLMVVYFLICSSLWWCMIAVDLFLRLILARQYRAKTQQRFIRDMSMNAFCYLTPILCVAGLAVGAQLGPDMYLPISFISVDPLAVSMPVELQWVFFFFPILLAAFVGLVLVGVVVAYLVQYQSPREQQEQEQEEAAAAAAAAAASAAENGEVAPQLTAEQVIAGEGTTATTVVTTKATKAEVKAEEKHHKNTQKIRSNFANDQNLRFKIQQGLKMFGFVLLMLVFIILLTYNQADLITNRSTWLQNVDDYASCVVSGQTGCTLSGKMAPSGIIISILALCTPGFLMFFLYFVFSTETYQLWAKRIGSAISLTWLEAMGKDDETDETGSTGSTGSKGSSSAGSSDLMGSDLVLNKKKRKHKNTDDGSHTEDHTNDGSLTETDGGHSVEMADLNKTNASSQADSGFGDSALGRPAAGSTTVRTKEQNKRRTTMFKGFKANRVPISQQIKQIQEESELSQQSSVDHSVFAQSQGHAPQVTYITSPRDHPGGIAPGHGNAQAHHAAAQSEDSMEYDQIEMFDTQYHFATDNNHSAHLGTHGDHPAHVGTLSPHQEENEDDLAMDDDEHIY